MNEVKDLTKLSRGSLDLCFFGSKASGKTFCMVILAYLYSIKHDVGVSSNVDLNFPYSKINTFQDFSDMSDCVCIMDDFEKYASSKFLKGSEKSSILEVTLNFSKRKVKPFMWSCKKPNEVDKTIRYCVDFFVECNFILKYRPGSIDEYVEMSKYLDCYKIVLRVINAYTMKIEYINEIVNLVDYKDLYDTHQFVKKLDGKGQAGITRTNLGLPPKTYIPSEITDNQQIQKKKVSYL